jgi:hypothetical protein
LVAVGVLLVAVGEMLVAVAAPALTGLVELETAENFVEFLLQLKRKILLINKV